MSAFWNKNNKSDKEKSASRKVAKAKKGASIFKKKREKLVIPKEKADLINQTLLQPKISEDALRGQEIGKYVFIVTGNTNKTRAKEAIETMYGVNVKKVNLVKYNPKKRNFRGLNGKNAGFKKVIVTLVKGETIDFFSAKK